MRLLTLTFPILCLLFITNCGAPEVNTNNPDEFQSNTDFSTTQASTKSVRSGTIPTGSASSGASVRHGNLSKTSANIMSGLYLNVNPATSFNVIAGELVTINTIIDASSQAADNAYFQVYGAANYLDFAFTSNVSGSFDIKFKVPDGATLGNIKLVITIKGTLGAISNQVEIQLTIIPKSQANQPLPPTQTITSLTTTTYQTPTTTTVSTSTTSTMTITTVTSSTTQTTTTTIPTTQATTTTTTLCFGNNCDGKIAFGGTQADFPGGYGGGLRQTSDGGYIMIGITQSNDGLFVGQGSQGFDDCVIIKLTNDGLFDSAFDGDGIKIIGSTGNDRCYDIEQTSDGGYILVGYSDTADGDFVGQTVQGPTDLLAVKLTSTGTFDAGFNTSGVKFMGGSTGITIAYSVHQSSDFGYVIGGKTTAGGVGDFAGDTAKGGNDAFIIKLTSTGALDVGFDLDGAKVIGGAGEDYLTHAIQTSDFGYALGGNTTSSDGDFATESNQGGSDFAIVKLNGAGAFDTAFDSDGVRLVGSSLNDGGINAPNKFIQTSDDGYMLAGFFGAGDGDFIASPFSGGSEGDAVLVKLTPTGVLDGAFGVNGVFRLGGTNNEYIRDVKETFDGGYVATGFVTSSDGDFIGMLNGPADILVLKLTSGGTLDPAFNGIGYDLLGSGGGDDSSYILQDSFLGGYVIFGNTDAATLDFATEVLYGAADMIIFRLNINGAYY